MTKQEEKKEAEFNKFRDSFIEEVNLLDKIEEEEKNEYEYDYDIRRYNLKIEYLEGRKQSEPCTNDDKKELDRIKRIHQQLINESDKLKTLILSYKNCVRDLKICELMEETNTWDETKEGKMKGWEKMHGMDTVVDFDMHGNPQISKEYKKAMEELKKFRKTKGAEHLNEVMEEQKKHRKIWESAYLTESIEWVKWRDSDKLSWEDYGVCWHRANKAKKLARSKYHKTNQAVRLAWIANNVNN